jgi:hypothetical protein
MRGSAGTNRPMYSTQLMKSGAGGKWRESPPMRISTSPPSSFAGSPMTFWRWRLNAASNLQFQITSSKR